ncbi:TatD family nuclease-associated radical SAM protein [Methermicoccus shengliensis]|uniref:Radical SAM protein n=1 Tax=Methermicoccus shengliensis TaxID=660064 RepID=A0A832RXU8_9EURY|nr:TatD family nuclease-associated radical SAM protein [Methermicoccus shengliensis]KUK04214.1 MAG: Radical SAM family protein [Euryarchaeota archaeon 55_53]KUK29943.1 MAG: Radical SAM family protein [Methanosarcinales archeaon 56_1174]MDI3488003.1 3,8-cyclase [Methanosarcinales archaeon]MDN5295599.1 3,8-cyclase [Methanosarcinales archaeon]HIH70391.1 radical SAM protein [Methermicoccus shengliensis]
MAGAVVYEGKGNLYLNITNRCTNDCVFCIRRFCDGVYGYNLVLEREPTVEEVLSELGAYELSRYREVVFTGFGEPLLRLNDVLAISRHLAAQGVKVRVDTNGHAPLLYPKRDVPLELKRGGVGAVSISLNAPDAHTYERLCLPKMRGAFDAMMAFARRCVEVGIETRLTVVGFTGVDVKECEGIASEIGANFMVR